MIQHLVMALNSCMHQEATYLWTQRSFVNKLSEVQDRCLSQASENNVFEVCTLLE